MAPSVEKTIIRKQELIMTKNPEIVARYGNMDSDPFEHKIMFVKNIVMSQNQELIFMTSNRKKETEIITVDTKNRYNQVMIYSSLFEQIGVTDDSHAMVIDLNMLVNRWCIFTIQNYVTNNAVSFRNLKDIILLDSEGRINLGNKEEQRDGVDE
ncbi:hypothetical protein FC19_GL000229 [Liquorilactobacillus aquaticus DSM 21051]|uniref:Uncharacterized protein n=1 Tax=Liquorilactobacillus aquaticus DSM 21051 TaxID=1423725 RepID=A0A0R2D7S4_9LACO|nr:hypothetical protein [Liquorilactobacillus aquaticus]KRM96713.1 hypothetical protein FC19_GL000229 [Liquorilactobacillus aquaticus DSM 21051]